MHLTSQQVAAECLLRAGKIFFPCISRYDCLYSAIFALLAYLAREKLCTVTQYTFPLYLSKHILDVMPGWQQKEKGGSVGISVLLKLQNLQTPNSVGSLRMTLR